MRKGVAMPENTLIELYSRLLPHHSLIEGAPALTLTDPDESQLETVRTELAQNACYLLGLPMGTNNIDKMLDSLEKNYKEEDFWRLFLLDYLTFLYNEEKQLATQQTQVAREKLMTALQEVLDLKQTKQETINNFAKKVEDKKFPIDARRLFKNYLNYADKHPDEAWEMITQNPAFFSPIKARDPKTGKVLIPPAKAIDTNKKLGSFIKGLKS